MNGFFSSAFSKQLQNYFWFSIPSKQVSKVRHPSKQFSRVRQINAGSMIWDLGFGSFRDFQLFCGTETFALSLLLKRFQSTESSVIPSDRYLQLWCIPSQLGPHLRKYHACSSVSQIDSGHRLAILRTKSQNTNTTE